jgi:hypothetical protein
MTNLLKLNSCALFKALLLASLLFISGCIGVANHMKDYIIHVPGVPDSSVNLVNYEYRGLKDSDTLILANERNLEAAISFDSIAFPTRFKWGHLTLSAKEANALKEKARRTLNEYFGSRHQIKLTTYKEVFKAVDKSYFIDAHAPHRRLSAAETLLEMGLAVILDKELLRRCEKQHLLKLEDKARRSNRGVWVHHYPSNVHYHD